MALSFLNRLGGMAGAGGANGYGAGVHGPLSGSPAAGVGSLGTPGRAGGAGMGAAGGPMGALGGGAAGLGLGEPLGVTDRDVLHAAIRLTEIATQANQASDVSDPKRPGAPVLSSFVFLDRTGLLSYYQRDAA